MVVVVGGHSRNIGKTSVVAGIIRALPEARWTAVKITQYGHGVCSTEGESCDCVVEYDHPYALNEESAPNATDSGRFLAAGAARSCWLRTATGQLGHGMPALRRILETSENVILESNSVLQFLKPDLYIVVVDFQVEDLKDSSRRYMDRADAFVVVGPGSDRAQWKGVPQRWFRSKPHFRVVPPAYVTEGLTKFVGDRLAQLARGSTTTSRVPAAASE